VTEAHKCK